MSTHLPKVLFVCTGNAGRSQMAQAMLAKLAQDHAEVFSAGVEPWDDLHPMAKKLMAEKGLDLRGHYPKHVNTFANDGLNVVITIGDRAETECKPFSPCVRRCHWPIDDPADADGTDQSEAVFRKTCARIEKRLPDVLAMLERITPFGDVALRPAISSSFVRPEAFRPETHLPMIRQAGFDLIEAGFFQNEADYDWKSSSAIRHLKQCAESTGVRIWSVHPPDTENLADADASKRQTQLDVLKRTVDVAAELGAAAISMHAGRWTFAPAIRSTSMNYLNEMFADLTEYIQGVPIMMCLETLQGGEDNLPNAEVISYVHTLPAHSYGVVLDTGHSTLAGDLPGTAQRAGDRLWNVHIHDNNGQGDQHEIPGNGTIDWPKFVSDFRQVNYAGPLMLEVHLDGSDNEYPALLKLCYRAAQNLLKL